MYFLKKQLDVSKEEEKEILGSVDSIKKAVDYGGMTIIDLSGADSALKVVQLSSLTIEQQIKDEQITLNKSLGFPPDQIVNLQSDIEPPSVAISFLTI